MNETKLLDRYIICKKIIKITGFLLIFFVAALISLCLCAFFYALTGCDVPHVIFYVGISCICAIICGVIYGCWLAHKCYKQQLCFIKMHHITTRTELTAFSDELEEQFKEIKKQAEAAYDYIFDPPQIDNKIFETGFYNKVKEDICLDYLFYGNCFSFFIETWFDF